MKSPFTKFSAVAATLIAAVLLTMQFTFVTPSFADVIRPIFEAKTFAFDMVVGPGGPVMHDRISGQRIRRTISNMPNTIMVIDIDRAQMLTMDTADHSAVLLDITGPLGQGTRNFMTFIRETITRLRANANDEPQATRGTVDGRDAFGYTLGGAGESVTVWADPETAAPLRIELGVSQNSYIIKNFEFDIPVTDKEFSLDPPAGYTLKPTGFDFTNPNEENLIGSLRVWAKYLNNGFFPPELSTQAYMTQIPLLEQTIGSLTLPVEEKEQLGIHFVQGMLFLQTYELRHEGPWHYAGAGVQLGAADTPIFWYQPQGNDTYRVIYGDLHVEDLPPDQLPGQ